MKIVVSDGHNFEVLGVRALIDETIEDAVLKYLRLEGHNILDVTPGN